MTKHFDILFLVDTGIGNAIELLYAVEYCILNGKKTGLCLGRISRSFVSYLRESYGSAVIVDDLSGISTSVLVHSWLYEGKVSAHFEHYFYINADINSTTYLSESEQYLAVARALYPSAIEVSKLTLLKEDYSERVQALGVKAKYVIYPGCDPRTPSKRWPYYRSLIDELGVENVIVIGGADDLNNQYSYYYPRWIVRVFPPFLLRKASVFRVLKHFKLLIPHSQLKELDKESFSYFNVFSWPELTALLRRAGSFIGNDGGLTQLAGACGASGVVIFGPSSVSKNRPYSRKLRPMTTALALSCQPCQFRVNGVDSMAKNSILCPYQVKCLYSIGADAVAAVATERPSAPSVASPDTAGVFVRSR